MMTHPKLPVRLPVLLLALAAAALSAQTISPVQSRADPLGLPIAGPVMVGGSDAASQAFRNQVLPGLSDLVNTRLSETHALNDTSFLLDPSRLTLKTDSDLRVYFVGEGAGYHNTLGVNAGGPGVGSGDPRIIFPDASSQVSAYDGVSGTVRRTAGEPLLPGDFVDLGRGAAGTKLDFFLIADGANGGRNVYSTTKSANPDGINHVVSFATVYSSYLLIGFEDLYGGGDRDFNDLVFAVDIGSVNLAALTSTSEPGVWMTMAGFLGVGLWLARGRVGAAA